ncbi:MAG: choice-of-anchor tandem repeat GloVer-containing protein, partial [Saprospiraceae bacterium]
MKNFTFLHRTPLGETPPNPANLLHRILAKILFTALLLLCCAPSGDLLAQTKLWGLTSAGGEGGGAIISQNTDGSDFEAVAFPFVAGKYPGYGHLLAASNGKMYGMTAMGGLNDKGVLFEYDPAADTYLALHHFAPATDGGRPFGSLIESGGKFYGMTSEGGSNNRGTLFEFNPTGNVFTVLRHFSFATDGGFPRGSLLESGGKFYGMTYQGGSNGVGTLFEFNPTGNVFTVLWHFDADTDGASPFGSLIASGGKFYGMTNYGGSNGGGTLFEFNPTGNVFTVLRHFDADTDGDFPYGSLIASGGKFYGMTSSGGSNGVGTLFEFNPTGNVFTVLRHFDAAPDGGSPFGSLLESGGKFYGMTSYAGGNGVGTLFDFNPTGNVFTVLRHFDAATDGGFPYGSLLESGGKFYGMTSYAGGNGVGTLFEFNPTGNVFTVLRHFDAATDGGFPYGSLLESGGKFYGMTSYAGGNGVGALFEFNPTGNVFTVKRHFGSAPDGGSPLGSMIASGGKFYGMTNSGGDNGAGTLFEFNPMGNVFTVLWHFNYGTDGASPGGSLLASGGKFYGMTSSGGGNDAGTLFEFNPTGNVFTVLRHFAYATGGYPQGSLLESGGKFYGMAGVGGSNGGGILFEFNPAGNVFTVLKNLSSSTDGGSPKGSLIESGGKFYGMTGSGGNNSVGTLFEFNPTGNVFNVLRHFALATDGGYPSGSLLESGGKFYGMTNSGGSNDAGTVFEFNPTGNVFTVLKHLGGADGARPYGDLIAAATPTEICNGLDDDGNGTIDDVAVTCTPGTRTWTGAVSTDWNTACNWDPACVPTADDDVVINDVTTNDPTITAGTAALAKSVAVNTGGVLTIAATGSLTIDGYANFGPSDFPAALGNDGTVTNNGTITIGANDNPGLFYGIYNRATFNNSTVGQIHIDRPEEAGILNEGGTFTNTATITIGANYLVGYFGIDNNSGTFNNTGGEINIDRSLASGILNESGTFNNTGTVFIGTIVGTGEYGLSNHATFNNTGGEINIDKSLSTELYNEADATFTNAATINIGQFGNFGANGIRNLGTFENNTGGQINIDGTTGDGLINENAAMFTNAATLTIGAVIDAGDFGIRNFGTFENNANGQIKIDRLAQAGLINYNSFSNAATINIGAIPGTTVGAIALENHASFTNTGGQISIDRSTYTGLLNSVSGTFDNAAAITIGANDVVGDYGLENQGSFENNTGGQINIDFSTVSGLVNGGASTMFANAATINIGANVSVGDYGILNLDQATLLNNACGQISMTAPLNNTATITNAGLFTVNTASAHTNSGTLTNDGIIAYPEGNPISGATNNKIVAQPKSGECAIPNILTLGSTTGFTIGSTWYLDANLTGQAGTYDQATNTFTNTHLLADTETTVYFSATDNTGSCARTVSIKITASGAATTETCNNLDDDCDGIIDDVDVSCSTGTRSWTGAVGTDWNTPCNWSPACVPTADDDVIIANASDYPTIAAAAVAKSVVVHAGAVLTVAASGSLTVNGSTGFSGSTTAFGNSGTVHNWGTLTIGSTTSAGDVGIRNNNLFNNYTDGQIHIDRSTYSGIFMGNGSAFNNSGSIAIGANASVGATGIFTSTNDSEVGAIFNNNTGGQISIDNCSSRGIYLHTGEEISSLPEFNNSGSITIAANASVGYGIQISDLYVWGLNFNNNACGVITMNAPFYNLYATFTNNGLFIVNTAAAHNNAGSIINNGIIAYPQGNPIPNVTNNEIVAAPNTGGNCVLGLGSTVDFSIGTTWYLNPNLTGVAGTYNQASNFFDMANVPANTPTTVYFSVTDNAGGCARTVSMVLTNSAIDCSPGTRTWTGEMSSDWTNVCNWSPRCVPTADDDVVIADVPNDPIIGAGTAAVAKSVVVNAGSGLIIDAEGSLTIHGSTTISSNTFALYNDAGAVLNSGTITIGSTASAGDYGIGVAGDGVVFNYAEGQINIDNTQSAGILNLYGFVNTGAITVGANASVGNFGVQNNGMFENSADGQISIDNTTSVGLLNSGSSATFTNTASITVGANASVGQYGLKNEGTFDNNGGEIKIDRSTGAGLINQAGNFTYTATFNNAANVTIGANESVGTFGLVNDGTFNNTGGHIKIDRSSGANSTGLFNTNGTFTNGASITVGANASVGQYGLYNNNRFYNNAGGHIEIDNATKSGLYVPAGYKIFENEGTIIIGANASVGEYGLWNYGEFTNKVGGHIEIDNCTESGLYNEYGTVAPNSFFTNEATVIIGANTGTYGIENEAELNNEACGVITLNANFYNTDVFTNNGLFTVNTTATHTNSGTVTNNGIIAYPQGNPILGTVANNEIIAAPISGTGNISPALSLGSPVDFNIGTTWFLNSNLTGQAGTFDQATNTFAATNMPSGVPTTVYFSVEDATGGCSRTASIQITWTSPCTPTTEVCDGVDNDCDTEIDEGVQNQYFADGDGDTYGDAAVSTMACSAPTGYVANDDDCDDTNASIKPGATEIAGDEVDQNCDGAELCFTDADDDGYRLATTVNSSDTDCDDANEGQTADGLDCDDANASIKPGATEIAGDEVDQ